jgi:exocyst complex component 2
MRDYKKGSFLNSSKSAQLIPGLPANTPAQKAQHKRVFDKVWSSVERIMSDMKNKLDRTLKDHNRSTEEQERTIEWVSIFDMMTTTDFTRILIELEGTDEAAWTYLEYQHSHILDTMKAMYSKSVEKVKGKVSQPKSFL